MSKIILTVDLAAGVVIDAGLYPAETVVAKTGAALTLPGQPSLKIEAGEGRRFVDDAGHVGQKWDGKALVLAAQPAIEDARAAARQRAIAFADKITSGITGRYPAAEVASWPTQEAEARAVIAGGDAESAPLISALATAAKMTLKDYADSVLAKASAYRLVVAGVKAIRDETEAAITAAATPEAVDAALGHARQTALAKAAQLGLA